MPVSDLHARVASIALAAAAGHGFAWARPSWPGPSDRWPAATAVTEPSRDTSAKQREGP
jgi:hypothetical protein